MLHIICPSCQSKLNAKEEILGQTRNCPKCGHSVLIEAPADAPDESLPLQIDQAEALPRPKAIADPPSELGRGHQYLILDPRRIVATWEANGLGWQLQTKSGPVAASRNTEELPAQGSFKLIELRLNRVEEGLHLVGIVCFELAQRWALPAIVRGDSPILEKIVGPAGLSRDQKQYILRYVREKFMPEVWRHREEITDFLSNTDFHGQGVC